MLMGSPAPGQAAYPDRLITGIVPFDVGGGADIFARLIAPYLGKALGQTVVIQNKSGAGGNVGVQYFTQSKPDGYTLLFNGVSTTQNPALFRHLPYDADRDIQPVAELVEAPFMIVVNPKVPARTLAEFVELLKKNPGKYNAGSGGSGIRLPIELFLLQNNLQTEIIPYNGTGDATTALLSGEVDFSIADASSLAGHIASGRVRALAVTGPTRQAAFPDVPTTTEAGLPQYQEGTFFGVFAPAGTPPDILEKLHTALDRIDQEPELLQRFRSLGWVPVQKSMADFTAFFHRDLAKWKDVVTRGKIPTVD